jgi:hypothetical protein
MRLPFAATAVGTFLSLLITAGHAQVVAPLSEIKITIADQIGAVLPDSEVALRSDSKTVVTHSGRDGSLTVTLPSGRYTVTASHYGFLKNEVREFEVFPLNPNELRIVLQPGPVSICTLPCGPFPVNLVPTAASDLPNVIEPKPEAGLAPSTQPVSRKARSWHCLYLWKCSNS